MLGRFPIPILKITPKCLLLYNFRLGHQPLIIQIFCCSFISCGGTQDQMASGVLQVVMIEMAGFLADSKKCAAHGGVVRIGRIIRLKACAWLLYMYCIFSTHASTSEESPCASKSEPTSPLRAKAQIDYLTVAARHKRVPGCTLSRRCLIQRFPDASLAHRRASA